MKRNGYEYILLEAGDWELGRLHRVLDAYARQGFELETAVSELDRPTGAQSGGKLLLWLKRRLSA